MPNYQKLSNLPVGDKPRIPTNLLALRKALDEIPKKMSDVNLLLATWNIREFDKPAKPVASRCPSAVLHSPKGRTKVFVNDCKVHSIALAV